MAPVVPLGRDWGEKLSFKYSAAQEMLWSLHVLSDPSHHQNLLSWALRVNSSLAPDLLKEVQDISASFDQWSPFLELVEALEGEKNASWEQLQAELAKMGQALFVYYALGRRVTVGELIKVIRQPALVEGFISSHELAGEKEMFRKLLANPEEVRRKFLGTLEGYWQQSFSSEMNRLEEVFLESLQDKIGVFRQSGLAELLSSLGLGFKQVGQGIEGEAVVGEEIIPIHLGLEDVQRIIVMPSVFAAPHLFPVYREKVLTLRYQCPYPEESQAQPHLDGEKLLQILKALADGTRLRILQMIAKGPKYTGEIAQELGFSEPTVSRHMKLLKSAGLVQITRADNFIYYSLDKQIIALVSPGLEDLFSE